MLPLNGKPMLEHVLERLAEAGFGRVLIVAGYREEMIREHFAGWEPELEFVTQDPIDGTGSATLLADEFAGSGPFLLTFGDILADPAEYEGLWQTLMSAETIAGVVAVKHVPDPWQGAAVYETAGRITKIVEKPPRGGSRTNWNSAGIFGFRPVVFGALRRIERSPRGEFELTSAQELLLSEGHDLRIHAIRGEWRDVGRPEDVAAAEEITRD